MKIQWGGAAMAGVIVMAMPQAADGQTANIRPYNIPAQDLGAALKSFAATSGREIVAASALLADKRSGAAIGTLTPEQAVAKLLAGTGLSSRVVEGAFVIRSSGVPEEPRPASGDIVVTGSRIRGAPIASPVITIGRDALRNSGQAGLGGVIRSLPQSFAGGQNPGIGTNVPAANGVDIDGGSSIDLRGLGSDATLTLLDGHRLSYSASRQSTDISAIPMAAVDRIEIVADGASALYGSDAVAGVANILLRHDVDGAEASLRLGTATDGGDFEQTYDALGGTTWASGGLVATYEHGSNSAIESKDRTYAETRSPGLTLFPALRHDSVLVTAHQSLTRALRFEIDALYNRRTTDSVFPLNYAGDLDLSRGRFYGTDQSYGVTPTLTLSLGDWQSALTASYGRDRADYAADLFLSGMALSGGAGYYLNRAKSLDLNGDGPLFRLPGGLAKLAVGAGLREIDFASFKGEGSFQNLAHSQRNYFGYGELDLPFVAPGQGMRFINRLNLSAALRYEDYPGIGDVVTPKIGLIYAPSPDVTFKASWGRSFRAPTLLEQYNPSSVALLPAARLGGASEPASATALLVQGGNSDLKPERAHSWSATIDLHPRSLAGAKVELSYFSTRYRDRIVTPIGSTAVALSNPIYRDLIILAPNDATQAGVIAGAGTFINEAGSPYDPATVTAIVDNDNVNAGRQTIKGVDLLLGYDHALGGADDALAVTLDAAYLDSQQQLSAAQPVIALAGTIFNPPHFRGRGGVTLTTGPVVASAMANYTGAVADNRFAPIVRLGARVTADFTLRFHVARHGQLLHGLDLSASVLNAFNAKPDPIRTTLYTDTPYDSTNSSPVGRFVSFEVATKW